jgi:hypothetical protein
LFIGLCVGKYSLTGNRTLTHSDQRVLSRRKVDIHARTETNEPDALACAETIAFVHEGHDAPRDESGNHDDR